MGADILTAADVQTFEDAKKFLDRLEKALLVIAKDGKDNIQKTSEVNDGLKIIKESFDELLGAIKAEKGSGGAGSSSGGAEINEETLELYVKKILMNDPDLREAFKKIIENMVTYNQNRDKVNSYIEVAESKKSSSFFQKNKFSLFIGFFAILATVGFWFNFSSPKIQITPSDIIYSDDNAKGFQINKDLEYPIVKVKDGKTYFSADGKTYYVKKTVK